MRQEWVRERWNYNGNVADPPKTTTSIREKFGVDYLIPESGALGSQVRSGADEPVERALAAYGHRILEMLQKAPQKMARVFEVVDATGLDIGTVQGVVDRMVRTGLLQVEETDKYGNHKILITPTGEQML